MHSIASPRHKPSLADARGNLTLDPSTSRTYGYSSENLLTSASGGVSFAYDPLLRLYSTSSGYRFAYDGITVTVTEIKIQITKLRRQFTK